MREMIHWMSKWSMGVAIMLAGWCGGARWAGAAEADHISLAGAWSFRLDREEAGRREQWFAASLPDRIQLPGSTAQAGYGDGVTVSTKWTGEIVDRSWFNEKRFEPYREMKPAKVPFWLTPVKQYVGPAWYQRTIRIPETWQGRRVTLFLERPHWETHVWVDDRDIGTQNSLVTPHEYAMGSLSPGEHRLTICVDNRVKVDVGTNAHSVSDHTQTNWNGIVGKIELRVEDPVWIDDLQIYPDVKSRSARVRLMVANATGAAVRGTLVLSARGTLADRVHAAEPKSVPFSVAGASASLEVDYPLGEGAMLWNEFTPAVYRLSASLAAEAAGQSYNAREAVTFGFREFKPEGTQFFVNGRPIFIRGTLECCIFPLTGYPPTDVDSWMRILRIAKAHGLNCLRFHSWCPPEAAFEAGDRLGFYFQVEGPFWATVGDDPAVDAFIHQECDRILRAYGNHPSFCMLAYGNEPGGGRQKRFLGDLVAKWKAADGRRVYTSAAGWPQLPENNYHCMPEPRVFAWGEGLSCRLNARPPETMTDYRGIIQKHKVPVVSHEIGQWCVYPNLDEIRKYTGVTRALNFEIFRDTLAANHMLQQAREFLLASGKLQALCYKEDIESALRTPGMGGFQLLDLHDFPGQGTALVGVLDPFWDSKGYITADEFRRFCAETVPLARLEKRIWTKDETLVASIEVAHFGQAPMPNAKSAWSLVTADGQQIARGLLAVRDIPLGNGIPLGKISVPLSSAPAPAKLVLTVSLEGTPYSNTWELWVYPTSSAAQPPAGVTVASRFDDAALVALKAGGKVLLMPAAGQVAGDRFGKIPPGFTSIFWNTAWTRRQSPHTLGVLCDPKHPALADFPTDFHSNWQWWDLISRSQTMILDGFPAGFRPIVQVIDDWHTNRRLGLVYEAKVNGGRMLVCGVDLTSNLESRPVARQMRASLLKYMASPAFDPKTSVDVEAMRNLFVPPATISAMGAKVLRADSEARGYEAARAIDGDPTTFWHTQWEPTAQPYPHELVIDLGKPVTFQGLRYLPRQDVHNGWARDWALYASNDGKSWGAPAASGTFGRDSGEKVIRFEQPRTSRYLKFVAINGFDGQRFATLAELDLIPARK